MSTPEDDDTRLPRGSSERMNGDAPLGTLERCAVVVAGIYLMGIGINVMTRGDVIYSNYLRWAVKAPLAVVVGAVLIVVGYSMRREQS